MPIHDRFEHALILLGIAAFAALLVGPAIRLAFFLGIVDRPDAGRKQHARSTAYLGGGVLWCALSIALAAMAWNGRGDDLLSAWGALTLLFLVGLADDAWDLPPWSRLVVQALAIGLLLGTRLETPEGVVDWILWGGMLVVGLGVVNAFNLLDGLDGLALGAGLLAASPYFLIAWWSGSGSGVAIALAFLAAGTGLLRGNLHPARIFLGDAGSLLVGGLLFTLPLWALPMDRPTLPVAIEHLLPVLLGLPVVDMVVVVFGRWRRGFSPLRGDRTHLHHRLQRVGLSHEDAVGWIHLAMATTCLVQVLLVAWSRPLWWMVLLVPFWGLGYALLGRQEQRLLAPRPEGVRHAH